MKYCTKNLLLSLTCLLLGVILHAQTNNKKRALGTSVGVTFGGPMAQMINHLESNNYDYRSTGGWFGPTSYPVKSGPRGEFSLSYLLFRANNKEFGMSFNYAELGEVAGLTGSGERLEVGFRSYTLGAFYQFGTRLTKLSVGPSLMLNKLYVVETKDFKETNEVIDDKITAGLKGTALIYFWNGKVTYGNIGVSYLLSLPTDYGPFPVQGNSSSVELEKTKLNFGYGSVFFDFGVKF